MAERPLLRRYWIRFEAFATPTPLNLGCGVTAFDKDDAIGLLHSRVFTEKEVPKVIEIIEDGDVSTLNAGHVRPNMGLVTFRGIWFPLGYDEAL
jgi:hypothetical protein